MNPHAIKNFFKTSTGRLLLVVAAVLIVAFFIRQHRAKVLPLPSIPAPQPAAASYAVERSAIPSMPSPTFLNQPAPKRETQPIPQAILPSELYTSLEPGPGPVVAPYGRLIRCELVNTVDSARTQTPIIGIVLQDVLNPGGEGEIVIPARTEVHGVAQVDRTRERIASQGQWVLSWTDGSKRELPLTGLALDHAPNPSGSGWRITDGSAGLQGSLIKTDNLAELKLIAATFISGMGQGLSGSTSTTSFGQTTQTFDGTIKTGLAQGVARGAELYAQQMLETIRQDGFYVRVPAGKTFYLYVTQTLDPSLATVAGSKASSNTANNPPNSSRQR